MWVFEMHASYYKKEKVCFGSSYYFSFLNSKKMFKRLKITGYSVQLSHLIKNFNKPEREMNG